MTTYDTIGLGYAGKRKPDPRIAAQILRALGDAESVVNIGAGAGSYEPSDRPVIAIEPAAQMIAQRPTNAAPCVQARAEALPFADGAFGAALAVLTIHHWADWRLGLQEMRRVARQRIVLLTFDVGVDPFWLVRDYLPALRELDLAIMPAMDDLQGAPGPCVVEAVEVPHDCMDGFLGAYWRRPETYLDPVARAAMSSFARIDATAGLQRLRDDLKTGAWALRNADVSRHDRLDVGYRLLRWELSS